MEVQENNAIEKNYKVFSAFISVLMHLEGFEKDIPRVIIMARSRMFKHKWVYPWKKMKLKHGRWGP